MQIAMSVYYNRDLTKRREKDKKYYDLITTLRECPTPWVLNPKLATIVDRSGTSTWNAQKGMETAPHTLGHSIICKGDH
jgi:hypothetical protein